MSEQDIVQRRHERRFTAVLAALGLVAGMLVSRDCSPTVHEDQDKLAEAVGLRAKPVVALAPPQLLPQPIEQLTASAVKLINLKTIGDATMEEEGSGVKVGPDLVLTAGHVALTQPNPNSLTCGNFTSENVRATPHTNDIVTGWAATNRPNDTTVHDLALLQVRASRQFDGLPQVTVAAKQPSKGDIVYFTNYENGDTGDHYPNERELHAAHALPGHAYPAQYEGVVIGHDGTDTLVATGMQGYGPAASRETNSYPGGSGGQVDTVNGQLMGVLSAIQIKSKRNPEPATYSHDYIADTYGVQLPGSGNAEISMVTTVTPAILATYRHDLAKPVC